MLPMIQRKGRSDPPTVGIAAYCSACRGHCQLVWLEAQSAHTARRCFSVAARYAATAATNATPQLRHPSSLSTGRPIDLQDLGVNMCRVAASSDASYAGRYATLALSDVRSGWWLRRSRVLRTVNSVIFTLNAAQYISASIHLKDVKILPKMAAHCWCRVGTVRASRICSIHSVNTSILRNHF